MLKTFLMATCALMITFSPAFAADKKPPMGMGPVDGNKDGVVSSAEAIGAADKQFAHLDGNKDGKITEAEFEASSKKVMVKIPPKFLEKNKDRLAKAQKNRFAMLDGNKDGNITKEEMKTDMQKRHKAMDLNKDGNVTKEELTKFHATKGKKK